MWLMWLNHQYWYNQKCEVFCNSYLYIQMLGTCPATCLPVISQEVQCPFRSRELSIVQDACWPTSDFNKQTQCLLHIIRQMTSNKVYLKHFICQPHHVQSNKLLILFLTDGSQYVAHHGRTRTSVKCQMKSAWSKQSMVTLQVYLSYLENSYLSRSGHCLPRNVIEVQIPIKVENAQQLHSFTYWYVYLTKQVNSVW